MSVQRIRRWLSLGLLAAVFSSVLFAPAAFAQEEEGGRKAKTKVTPVYPELAQRLSVSGAVKIQVTITAAGVVKSTKVIGGHPLLVGPAVDAVKKWKFEPASEETTQTVVFMFNNR